MPHGMVHVAAGLLVLGLSSYGFLVVSARAVAPASFAALSVLYMLVYTFIPGVFLPYEQELARALADRRARSSGAGPLLHRIARSGGLLMAALAALTLALSPILVGRLFNDSVALLVALLVSIVGLGVAYVSRGVYAGLGRFGHYGAQLAIEGGVRFVTCSALAAAGVTAVGAYGFALSTAFLVAVALTFRPVTRLNVDGPPVSAAELGSTIRWLIAGALLSLGVLNAGPVVVKLLDHGASGRAGDLLAGLVLARLPLFLFAAVQAALVPALAAALARREFDRFRTDLGRIVALLAAVGAVATGVLAVAGPQLLHLFFGARYDFRRGGLVVLGIGTLLYMVASGYANALLAMKLFPRAAYGWLVGAVAFAVVLVLPLSLFDKVEYGFLTGGVTSAATFALFVRAGSQQLAPVAVPVRKR
jgi:O-antigen/teichoic acid export membrane protein